MTALLLTRPTKKQHSRLSSQLATILEDLTRLSRFTYQLSDLTDEQLESFDIADQLDAIHCCLNRFEAHCMAIKIASYEDEFAAPVVEESEFAFPRLTGDWNTVRREVKRVNKLSGQLTESLSKIRAGLSENQYPVGSSEDIRRINQILGNDINGLASDCLLDHG